MIRRADIRSGINRTRNEIGGWIVLVGVRVMEPRLREFVSKILVSSADAADQAAQQVEIMGCDQTVHRSIAVKASRPGDRQQSKPTSKETT